MRVDLQEVSPNGNKTSVTMRISLAQKGLHGERHGQVQGHPLGRRQLRVRQRLHALPRPLRHQPRTGEYQIFRIQSVSTPFSL